MTRRHGLLLLAAIQVALAFLIGAGPYALLGAVIGWALGAWVNREAEL